MSTRKRLAIVSTHPIQYYAPWFRRLSGTEGLEVRVFYLLEPSAAAGLFDQGFERSIRWDTPLLEGYSFEFVPNVSSEPGTGRFLGLRNPSLASRVRAFKPDAILMNGYAYWSLVRFALAWPRGDAPLVLRGDSHRIAAGRALSRRFKDALIGLFFRRFAAFLYVGQANYRYFRMLGVPERKLFRAPHAVDEEVFSTATAEPRTDASTWRRELDIPENHLVILFAGKFEEKKRPLDLLEAFRVLDPPRATLLFVGSGALEGRIRAAASLVPNVRIAPFQNQSRMPRTYAACDLFVLPSYGEFETWGLAVNEAMCMGKPAIVSNHVGCAEDLVLEGKTGLVFQAGDIESLRKALGYALDDRQRLAEWGRAAATRVSVFSYPEATRGLLAALQFASAKQ